STGEEAYSIAILFREYMIEHRLAQNGSATSKVVQIFATDLSNTMLDRARKGLYSEESVEALSAERLKRFFVRTDGSFQINKSIREMCIFARQNVISDPPFSNLDLVSCRNLLIYLDSVLQRRVIPILHYSLKLDGYLMLGGSETLTTFSEYFTAVDKKHKIYQKRKGAAVHPGAYAPNLAYSPRSMQGLPAFKMPQAGFHLDRETERALANRFVPASIVVNESLEIVQFRGRTGAYLEPAAGSPSNSLAKMARDGLFSDLRIAIEAAKTSNAPVHREGLRILSDRPSNG